MERKVEVIEVKHPIKKLNVCAYARVSTDKEEQFHSLQAQEDYYKNLIAENPKWNFVEVYSDRVTTGTKDTRQDFQRMLQDCRDEKIDLIISKSISRFARNTVTLLNTIRELKLLIVDVYFEEQKIHTMDSDGKLLLSILAGYAQEESFSVSENVKWKVRKDLA